MLILVGVLERSVITWSGKGLIPVPSRSPIYRALIRHRLIDPQQRRKRRSDYKRWERARSMELWQMDITGWGSSF